MRRSIQRPGLVASVAVLAVLAAVVADPAESAGVNWVGGSSFWDLATNWGSNPLLPGAADDVVINVAGAQTVTHRSGTDTVNSLSIVGDDALAVTGGSLTVANGFSSGATTSIGAGTLALNGASTMASLAQSGGVLGGSGNLVVGAGSSWLAGTQTGTGSTRYDGALALTGAGTKVLSGGRTVTLTGITTWGGNTAANNGSLQFAGGTLHNAGTFNDQNGFASFIDHSSGTNAFSNIGTYNKQANTVTTVEAIYNNTGTTNVNAGTMLMQGTSTSSSTGVYNLAAGAVLEFRNGSHTLDHTTIQGPGTFVVSTENVGADVVVTLNGGTLTSPFLFSGSTIAGTDRTFQGSATWTGGTFSGTAVTTFANDLTISGPNTKVIVGGGTVNLEKITTWSGNTAANNNAIQFWNGATINNRGTFNDANAFASFIEHSVGGPHNFNNIGTYNKLANTLTTVDLGVVFNNSGTLNLNAGTMRFVSGTQGPVGTINVASGATYQHDAASTAGVVNTAGTLNVAASALTVSGDYNNANFGTGNAFNRRANVVTTGAGNRLVAAGDANQGITGAGVLNGNTATPTLTIGNVHVGSTTYSYHIANTGSTGPVLRGAIQTSVNGGNITDPRLSGSGVTAGNWGPLATGGSLSRDVVITVAAAGSLAPLAGQSVAIVNNFDNTRSQVVTFGLAANAGAYRLAEAGTLAPVAFGNVHVGDVVSRALTIGNLAPNDGFSERLNASFASANDPRIAFAGAVNGLGAGSSNTSSMTVGLNTAAAGGVNGAVIVNFASDGTGTSGLGLTTLPSQSVGVSGTIEATGSVFRLASASPATPNPVNFGNVRVGAAATQALTIGNAAANDGFSEKLNALIGAATAGITAAGSFNLLGPQSTNNASLVVGIDTATAGARNGTATISLASDGSGTSGLGITPLTPQTVAVNGAVYRVANPTLLPPSLTLAARVGDAAPVAALAVTNASPDAFTERLDASFGAVSGGFVGAGSITGLVAGASSNALSVSLNTASAGGFTGNAGVSFVSSGAGTTGAADLALPGQAVALTGHVYTPGAAQLNTAVVDFGILHRGDTVAERVVSVTTSAPVSAANDTLRASLGAAPTGFTSGGTLAGLAAGATDATSLRIGVNSAAAGTFAGSVTATFASHDNELADLALGSATIALQRSGQQLRRSLARQERRRHVDPPGRHLHARLRHADARRRRAVGEPERAQQRHRSGRPVERCLRPERRDRGLHVVGLRLVREPRRRLDVRWPRRSLRRRGPGHVPGHRRAACSGSNASGYAGALGDTFLVLRGDVAVAAVPEPETYVLMLAGLLVVARVAQRRRQRSSAPDAR